MTDQPPEKSPARSLSAFVESMAHFLRTEAKEASLKGRVVQDKTGSAHKIEMIALMLRKQAKKKRRKRPK